MMYLNDWLLMHLFKLIRQTFTNLKTFAKLRVRVMLKYYSLAAAESRAVTWWELPATHLESGENLGRFLLPDTVWNLLMPLILLLLYYLFDRLFYFILFI